MWQGHPSFPDELRNQFNTTVQVREFSIATEPSPSRPSDIASKVRAEINTLKADPVLGGEWLSTWAHWFVVAVREGKLQDWVPPVGTAMVNSNMRYDWAPSFGMEGGSSYHTQTSLVRFLRVFRANPTERGGEANGAVELGFSVPSESLQRIRDLVEEDKRQWSES